MTYYVCKFIYHWDFIESGKDQRKQQNLDRIQIQSVCVFGT